MSEPSKNFIAVEVTGKSPGLWQSLRPKLLEVLNSFLNTVIDTERNKTIKEEAQKFTSLLLDYGKQKLSKAGLENEKIIAEVELLYSHKQKELAEARKLSAEAEAIEFNTSMRKLKGLSKDVESYHSRSTKSRRTHIYPGN